MKNHVFTSLLIVVMGIFSFSLLSAQVTPSEADIEKMMQEAMEDMDESEKEEMSAMMKQIMPALTEKASTMASYPDFSGNLELAPKKDAARIGMATSKLLSPAELAGYSKSLHDKMLLRASQDEQALLKSVLSKSPAGAELNSAAVLAMMQGHEQVALLLSMKAVQSDPGNPNFANNMAVLLTQYGYPELAIPVLNVLIQTVPNNSTVLNNLGQAWFALGDPDQAKGLLNEALSINPGHSEAAICAGVISEITGDPHKATERYVQAMENAPNAMAEKILTNKSGSQGLERIDYKKLSRMLTIYEYFPPEWIKIPQLSDNVAGYERDIAIQNGYSSMFETLKNELEQYKEAAEDELELSMDKGENTFAAEMAKENIKGVSAISTSAATILKVIMTEMARVSEERMKEYQSIHERIEQHRQAIAAQRSQDDKCPDFDRQSNEELQFANPLIRDYYTRRIEEMRTLVNAYCTWTWYLTGNPKNVVMAQCLGMVEVLMEMYEGAAMEQLATTISCVEQDHTGSDQVAAPQIPNFSCPAVVHIPIGSDWQQLSKAADTFEDNRFGIKKNPSAAVPNQTISLGTDAAGISQPGLAPFVKTANGTLMVGLVDASEDELAPLTDVNRAIYLQKVLNRLMTADCSKVKSEEENWNERWGKMNELIAQMDAQNAEEKKVNEQIRKDGLSPTLNSGVQVPGTFNGPNDSSN